VSVSNPEELLYVLQRDVSTSLDMTENSRATPFGCRVWQAKRLPYN